MKSRFAVSAMIPLALAGLTMMTAACVGEIGQELDEAQGETAIQALEAAPGGPKVYIVRLKPGVDVDSALKSLGHANAAAITHRYHHALQGGALLVPTQEALARIQADERVLSVEADQPVRAGKPASGITTPPPQLEPTGYRLIGARDTSNRGAGVTVAVIDTGADLDHSDLADNLELDLLRDCVNEPGTPGDDLNGHGTHVSGTIAAVDNTIGSIGVGAEIRVAPVKVLNRRGSGSWSTVICGVDYVAANAGLIKVANMSLGGSGSECSSTGCTRSALQVAVENAVAAGVTVAVAAGNQGADASTSVPAAYDAVITVSAYSDSNGAVGTGDGWPSFTNYGADVDIAAPGVNIFSTWKGNAYKTISGTSMATPHVTAAAALYLADFPDSTPEQVKAALRAAALSTFPGSRDPKHAEPLLDVRTF